MKTSALRALVIGGTGAVGSALVATLLASPQWTRVTTLGRRPTRARVDDARLVEHIVDLVGEGVAEDDPRLAEHDAAFCTLGIGEPSKVSPAELRAVEHGAVLRFARACRAQGVAHFSVMTSVIADPRSRVWQFRLKGEIESDIAALGFARTSFFRPSMILTKTNRYGLSQGVLLATWPLLSPLLAGGLRRYRGIAVEDLGRAIARNAALEGRGLEVLEWDDFQRLAAS